jgi:hypothetical protein
MIGMFINYPKYHIVHAYGKIVEKGMLVVN